MVKMDGSPAYRQVADDLRQKIADDTYPVGTELPSTQRLIGLYGVSLTVVRAAVRELREEDLVRGQPGKGVYVQRKPDDTVATSSGEALKEEIRQFRESVEDTMRDLSERVAHLEQETRSHQQEHRGDDGAH